MWFSTRAAKSTQVTAKDSMETYDGILASIADDDMQQAIRLCFSVRMVSLDEAIDVLATHLDADGESLVDSDRRPWDPRNVLTICSSLVTITASDVSNGDMEEVDARDLASTQQLKPAYLENI